MRREEQLVREVYRVLAESITVGEVMEVRPAPDMARLAVWVRPWPGDDPARALETLTREKGRLRAAIAAALQRKRTPDLVFEVFP
jgi:ribosome-binding factor A